MARIGLKNAYAAVYDEATNTYETPVKLSPAISANVTPNFESTTLYGDDRAVYVEESLSTIDMEISTTDLTNEDYILLMGVEANADGVIEDSVNDVAPYVAIGFEMPKTNGGVALRWYYKGRFQKAGEEAATKGETVEFQPPALTATFMAREDGKWRARVDYKDAASIDEEVYSTWYDNVYEPVVTP